MKDEALPIRYNLEVYESSFASKEVSYYFKSSSPLPALSVGDRFNHRTIDSWVSPPNTETEAFEIKEIEHIFFTIEGSHIGYKMMVRLEVVPYDWS